MHIFFTGHTCTNRVQINNQLSSNYCVLVILLVLIYIAPCCSTLVIHSRLCAISTLIHNAAVHAAHNAACSCPAAEHYRFVCFSKLHHKFPAPNLLGAV